MGKLQGDPSGSNTLAAAVAADGATGGFVKDSEVSTFARTYLDETSARATDAVLGTWHVLAASAVAVPLTGTTDETALATIAIPAGAIGANGQLRITMHWSATNDASGKTIRVRLGGLAGTALWTNNVTSSATARMQAYIANRNSAASQIGSNISAFSTSSGGIVTATVNTALAQDLVISGQHADGTDTMTLESYSVELFYQA